VQKLINNELQVSRDLRGCGLNYNKYRGLNAKQYEL
jgi:hypothetical protein